MLLVLATACAGSGPEQDIAATVEARVAATVAAQAPPTPTPTPPATPTPTLDRYPYLHPLAKIVHVEAVVADPETDSPIVLLKSADGDRYLPIWIGPLEAVRIAYQLQDIPTDRPLTHDLLGSVIRGLGGQVKYVVITRLDQGTYYAEVVLDQQGTSTEVDARPSDAIALALEVRAPIYTDHRVLETAGFDRTALEATTTEDGPGPG